MREHLTRWMVFGLAVVILLGALKFFNWLPGALQEGALRRYASIEEVRSVMKDRKIHVPAYFPESFKWPPSTILAQKKPFSAVVMEFDRLTSGEVGLIILQADSKDFLEQSTTRVSHVQARSSCTLKGRDAVVESGRCGRKEPCSRITFKEDGFWIGILMRAPEYEAIILAESMVPEEPE
ncbi:MAG: hypothetical protein R3231_06345 [bacterium]|nr:hypothetical protein [bacterium]